MQTTNTTAALAEQVMDSPALLNEARGWIVDCFPEVEYDEITPTMAVNGVRKYYDGGLAAFVRASS